MSRFCLVCGDRGVADAILNVVLFLPLGAIVAMGGGRRAPIRATAAGMAISLGIEVTQALIPGRFATAGDVLWNATGGAGGAVLWLWLTHRISAAHARDRGVAAALLAGALLCGAGLALEPHLTEADYWGQWTPNLGQMPQYGGQVIDADLNGVHLPAGRLDWRPPPRSALQGPWVIRADIVIGPRPNAVSPIVSIYDARQMEILLLGADGADLVLRERTVAKTLLLDQPELRIPGAFEAVTVGDTTRLGASRDGDRRCLSVGRVTRCGLGFTVGRAWALLYYPGGLTEALRNGLNLIWLAALFFPVGFVTTSRSGAAIAGVVALGGTTLAAAATRFLPPPPSELLAITISVALGFLAARRLRSWARSRSQGPDSAFRTVSPG